MVQDPPNNLFWIYCGIFLFAADVAPADHRVCRFPSGYTRARDSERTHTHTVCPRFAVFTGQNGAESKHGHLRLNSDRFSWSLV